MSADDPAIECKVEDGTPILYLAGTWRLREAPAMVRAIGQLALPRADRFVVDGAGIQSLDTAGGFLLLTHLAEAGCPTAALTQRRFDAKYDRLMALVRRSIPPPAAAPPARPGPMHDIGAAIARLGQGIKRNLSFLGNVTVELLDLVRRPGRFRPRETASQLDATCVKAIPIVALVNFLIGVVIADVLGVEAQAYGAKLYVADGVALGVCRELSPILGSVLVAGRSGAAFTAEIGTMVVEEEVDAIATLGLSPLQVLVIPRLLALVVAMPLLVVVGDIAGVLGGMAISSWALDFAAQTFLDRVRAALELRHVFVGLGKAPVFAVFIAIIACRMGLAVRRDARSVGENTTSTVVQCIVWVIVLDALFAVAFQRLQL